MTPRTELQWRDYAKENHYFELVNNDVIARTSLNCPICKSGNYAPDFLIEEPNMKVASIGGIGDFLVNHIKTDHPDFIIKQEA